MERDALLEYGANYLQQERMVVSSDAYQALVCQSCGAFATTDIETGEPTCKGCEDHNFTRVNIPYAFKLLTNYLNAVGMKVTLRTRRI